MGAGRAGSTTLGEAEITSSIRAAARPHARFDEPIDWDRHRHLSLARAVERFDRFRQRPAEGSALAAPHWEDDRGFDLDLPTAWRRW